MFKKIITVVTLVAFAMSCVLLLRTTPSSIGPLGVLGFFLSLYLTALGVLTFLFYGIGTALRRARMRSAGGEKVSFRRMYYYASVTALLPVMLLALQSVSRIEIYHIVLMVLFIVIAWVYISRRAA